VEAGEHEEEEQVEVEVEPDEGVCTCLHRNNLTNADLSRPDASVNMYEKKLIAT